MTAFREGGSSRIFYVEHVCQSSSGGAPKAPHVVDGKVRNQAYMVRMFYTGDLGSTEREPRADPEEFEYMTDMMPFPDKHSSGYTNCPLCGSKGQIRVDEDGRVSIFSETVNPIVE